jgi:YHS domain-containing protein
MQVDEQEAAGRSESKNRTYYFCAMAGKQEFDRDPQRYVDKQTKQTG